MSKDVKIEIIYFKNNTDVSLEFGLRGDYPIRLLASNCNDLNSFFHSLKRAVMRSEIIIVTGGYEGNEYLPVFLAKSIGHTTFTPDLSEYGIVSEKQYIIPNGAIPLAPSNKQFGGFIIECGPQTIISLTDNKEIRLKITEEIIVKYIKEHYLAYNNYHYNVVNSTNEETIKSNPPYNDIQNENKNDDINQVPLSQYKTENNNVVDTDKNPNNDVVIEEKTDNITNKYSSETDTTNNHHLDIEEDELTFDFDLVFETTKQKKISKNKIRRIISIILILLILAISCFVVLFFSPNNKPLLEADNTLSGSISNNSFNESTESHDENYGEVIEQQPDFNFEIIIPPVSSSTTSSSNTSSSSSTVSDTSTTLNSSVTSVTSSANTSTELQSSTTNSQATSSNQTSSESVSSIVSENNSSQTTSEPVDSISTWDINVSVTSGGIIHSGRAIDIVARMIEAEMGSHYPIEALKAHAIASYNWLLNNKAHLGSAPSVAIKQNANSRAIEAANAVKGEILMYGNIVAQTNYYACSAGKTANNQDIWQDNNWQNTTKVPTLQSVDCSVDTDETVFLTTTTYSSETVKELIKEKLNIDVSNMPKTEWIVPWKYDNNNLYCVRVKIGGVDFQGQHLRTKLFGYYSSSHTQGLRSSAYTVSYDEASDTFTIVCKGWGHGVGMSQYGARDYANMGWTYKQILTHFFTGTHIENYN